MKSSPEDIRVCAACGGIAEGNYSVHRDGFCIGPEAPLCDACGSEVTPTLPDIWERIRTRREHAAIATSNEAQRNTLNGAGLPHGPCQCAICKAEPIMVDYWCSDCQDWFRSERTPVHAPQTPCPECGGKNTYETWSSDDVRPPVESGFD